MSNSEDRRQRDLDLLRKSYKALESEQEAGETAPANPGRRKEDPRQGADDRGQDDSTSDGDDNVMMYRGRPVRMGSGGIPGAGSTQKKGTQFRGAGGAKNKSKKPAGADQLKTALNKLTELYKEGLITKAEYDAKRRQILDRL